MLTSDQVEQEREPDRIKESKRIFNKCILMMCWKLSDFKETLSEPTREKVIIRPRWKTAVKKKEAITLRNEHVLEQVLPDHILNIVFSYLLLSPQQQVVLSGVCNQWFKVLTSRPYFFGINREELDYSTDCMKVAMAIAPVNSSGDIYHMLATLFLSCSWGNKIPLIYLAEDSNEKKQERMEVKEQVIRALDFVSALGYQDCFCTLHTEYNDATHPVTRQNQLVASLRKRGVIRYLDNRLSTGLIAWHVQQYGLDNTTAIIRKAFENGLQFYYKNNALEQKTLNEYLEKTEKQLHDLSSKNKPIIVLHYRESGKSNKQQSISTIVQEIITFLKSTYSIVVVCAGGGYNLDGADLTLDPFNDVPNVNKKICHLALLLQLYYKRNVLKLAGVIGNTSGTLDLAAFIGHKIFNIHNFEKGVDYQAWRLLLQSYFMSIENANNILRILSQSQRNKGKKYPTNNRLLRYIDSWLHDFKQVETTELDLVKKEKPRGFNKTAFQLLDNIFYLSASGKNEEKIVVSSVEEIEGDIERKFGKTIKFRPS